MFKEAEERDHYIREHYPEVTDNSLAEDHWAIYCPTCKITQGFQVVRRAYATKKSGPFGQHAPDWGFPFVLDLRCPVCRTFKQWMVVQVGEEVTDKNGDIRIVHRLYRLASIPDEGMEDIQQLPSKPEALRAAYRQAIRAMSAGAYAASAAMFRRALQVITRDILKTERGNLASALQSIIGKTYNGVAITRDFSEIAYVVKEAGDQGAHPDKDLDLLDFTQQDAEDLQKIFMELVGDIFVAPEAAKKARENFMQRRKIVSPLPVGTSRKK